MRPKYALRGFAQAGSRGVGGWGGGPTAHLPDQCGCSSCLENMRITWASSWTAHSKPSLLNAQVHRWSWAISVFCKATHLSLLHCYCYASKPRTAGPPNSASVFLVFGAFRILEAGQTYLKLCVPVYDWAEVARSPATGEKHLGLIFQRILSGSLVRPSSHHHKSK